MEILNDISELKINDRLRVNLTGETANYSGLVGTQCLSPMVNDQILIQNRKCKLLIHVKGKGCCLLDTKISFPDNLLILHDAV